MQSIVSKYAELSKACKPVPPSLISMRSSRSIQIEQIFERRPVLFHTDLEVETSVGDDQDLQWLVTEKAA
jgi:hypothetical protein